MKHCIENFKVSYDEEEFNLIKILQAMWDN